MDRRHYEKSKSDEDYLKNILILRCKNGHVRATDIAAALGVTKPSVSVAMKKLRGLQMISIDSKGNICLTEEGRAVAEKIYHKHRLIKELLMHIGVSEKTASEEACLIEHIIGEETFDRLEVIYGRMV